jgi:hypothetical protein
MESASDDEVERRMLRENEGTLYQASAYSLRSSELMPGRSRLLDESAVNVFAMSNLKDGNFQLGVVNEVYDSINTLTHAIAIIVPRKFLRAAGPWFGG